MPENPITWLLGFLGTAVLGLTGTLLRLHGKRLDNYSGRINDLEKTGATRIDINAMRDEMREQHREVLQEVRGVHKRIDGILTHQGPKK